jgi:hypothetical protein
MTAQDVQDLLAKGELLLTTIAKTVEGVDPGVAIPTEIALQLALYFGKLISTGVQGWEAGSGVEITPETIAALKADRTPLVEPTDDPAPAEEPLNVTPMDTKTPYPVASPSNPSPTDPSPGTGNPEDPEVVE